MDLGLGRWIYMVLRQHPRIDFSLLKSIMECIVIYMACMRGVYVLIKHSSFPC